MNSSEKLNKKRIKFVGGEEKSFIKGLGFCNTTKDSNPSIIDVKDGKIVRVRPLHFDWKYDKQQFNPWKMEAHGKVLEPLMKSLIPPYSLAYKKRVYSPNRVLFPLKRMDWDPHGERNPQNRGQSQYQRISWEEALEIISSEIKRVEAAYGPYAILSQSDGHGEVKTLNTAHGCNRKLLNLLGGFTLQVRNTDSWEGWYWGAKHTWGMEPVGQMEPSINIMPDIAQNSEMLLFWGCDPETTPWGFDGQMASRLCYFWSELGIKQVYICPDLNYGAAVHADKWIPVIPGTDAALQLAIAYIWITKGLFNEEYVRTHTFGFAGFADYVLGKEDGIPKTPRWASQKCGISEWVIEALAREWAGKRTTIVHGNGGPGIRSAYSTENGRLEVLLLAMQGLGRPGVHQVKMIEWGMWANDFYPRCNPMPDGIVVPNLGPLRRVGFLPPKPSIEAASQLKSDSVSRGLVPKQFIPKDLIPDAILKPPISWYGTSSGIAKVDDQFIQYTYPVEGCSEVHMIWTDTPCWITCWNDSNTYIKALRSPKIEFILAQHPWMENDCLLADLILPVSTKFEQEDISNDNMSGQFCTIFHEGQCIDPEGESKSDFEIVCLIAEKLGLVNEYRGNKTTEELIRSGFETSGVQSLVTYSEFKEKGYFVVPTDPEWPKYPVTLQSFYEDPEHNPLNTPSGKIEFYSQNLARYFPNDKERPPVPHWIENGESHDERLSSPRAGKYPLLMVSNHGRWRVHANHDDIPWTREITTCKVTGSDGYKYEPLWINPSDAASRGIRNGDIVQVYNERGFVLGGACVTPRIMTGAVYMDHGARYDPIVPGEIDRGGAINTITPHNVTSKNATGMVCSSFLVEVKLADLAGLRQKYPDAFNRPYSPEAGLIRERAIMRTG
jgi:anaerobic selenocysteine-containing dehydrogenase